MRRRILTAAVVAAIAVLPAGCDGEPAAPSGDNTAQICGEYWAVSLRYSSGDAPERLALEKASADVYAGRAKPDAVRAATVALFRAKARDLRPVADRARRPELRSALAAEADYYDSYAARTDPDAGTQEMTDRMGAVTGICPTPPTGPPPTP
jgi:hypothetical protein